MKRLDLGMLLRHFLNITLGECVEMGARSPGSGPLHKP